MKDERVAMIEQRLREVLRPERLEIGNQSSLHAGHTGAASGGGHYDVTIVSGKFDGLNQVARHRLVYNALADVMGGQIHALSITALAPEEI